MPKPRAPPTWIELHLDRSADEIRVSARGSRGEQTAPRPLGADHDVPALLRFAASVQQAAARACPLAPELVAHARAIQQALLGGEIGALHARLREAAGGPLLVRLMVHDPELQAVPWEGLCKPGEALGFWGSSQDLYPVRGVTSSEPWQPREVRGAVRVLALSPTGGGLAVLKNALADRIASGEVEWLDPVEGRAARNPHLFDRLRREPIPHVLHFLGHGGLDKEGMPVLRLADDEDGEETWLPVELLAQQLQAGFRGLLRLVVLEACEGARPSVFASAAEILARAGADAVVAHLWPVRADVARTFSAQLYRALAGPDRGGGDVALGMNEARRALLGAFEASAEALSPVLYLRAPEGTIFDFDGRKVAPPLPTASPLHPVARSTPHNLPPRRLFVGRKDELKLVGEALARDGRSSIAQAAVWGLGGVGKTALALRYAYDALDAGSYPGGIFWVLAEGRPVDTMARLAGIVRKYAPSLLPDLPAQTPPAELAEAVRFALENLAVPSLLVLDNVSERWGAEMLPGGQVKVLMTLRDRRLGVGKPIALDVLSFEDARTLAIDLVEKTPENHAEEEALRRVLEHQLGGLAVAVEVAARAVREWARSWVEYEKHLATQPRDALDAEEDRSPNYDPGVFAALDLSIDRCGENARKLLEGAAVFAPDAVPLDWAYAAAGLTAENIPAKRALGELEALGLVKVADKAGILSMHRLVHKRVRDRVEVEAWNTAGKRAVERVRRWIDPAVGPAKEEMDAVEARREHLLEALAAAERVGSMKEWSIIANDLAVHLHHRAESDEARSLWERALAIDEKTYGSEHPTVAVRLSNLAQVLKDLGESAQALPLVERALTIAEKTYGPEHPDVAIRLSIKAGVLMDLGEPAQARPLLERALTIAEKTYDPEHPDVAVWLSNLAMVLQALGEPAQALLLLKRALANLEKTYGSEHPYVARLLSNVAAVLTDQGEPAQARPSLERAVTIAEKTLPSVHPDLAVYRERLAEVRKALEDPPTPKG